MVLFLFSIRSRQTFSMLLFQVPLSLSKYPHSNHQIVTNSVFLRNGNRFVHPTGISYCIEYFGLYRPYVETLTAYTSIGPCPDGGSQWVALWRGRATLCRHSIIDLRIRNCTRQDCLIKNSTFSGRWDCKTIVDNEKCSNIVCTGETQGYFPKVPPRETA